MTRDEFEAKAMALMTEAVEADAIGNFILLYTVEGSKSTYTISDAPSPELIAEVLRMWVGTYEKKGIQGTPRVFADGVELKGGGEIN